jgi:hypothetical protein
MTESRVRPLNRTVFRLFAVGYAFLVALAVIFLEPLGAAVMFLALQTFMLLLAMPVLYSSRPAATTVKARILAQGMRFRCALILVAAGAVAAFLASWVTPVAWTDILLISIFALCFGAFAAGVCAVLRMILTGSLAQGFTLAVGLLMLGTPYYINPFILATAGRMRMWIVQTAVNVNPLLAGANGILGFDWLRSRDLYENCLIGGYQYPFYYPSAVKVGIILASLGIILMGVSTLRKAGSSEAGD